MITTNECEKRAALAVVASNHVVVETDGLRCRNQSLELHRKGNSHEYRHDAIHIGDTHSGPQSGRHTGAMLPQWLFTRPESASRRLSSTPRTITALTEYQCRVQAEFTKSDFQKQFATISPVQFASLAFVNRAEQLLGPEVNNINLLQSNKGASCEERTWE